MLYFCFPYMSGTLNVVYVNGVHSILQLLLEKVEFPYELLYMLNLFILFNFLEFPDFHCIGAMQIICIFFGIS